MAAVAGVRGRGDGTCSRCHDELAGDAMAVIRAAGVRHVVPVSQAHGGWPALRLRRLLGNQVPRIILLSWMVLDPPPPFTAVFEMLEDPGRWRQGLDNLLGGWLAGAPEDVDRWTRRETGSYGFDMWSRAACGHRRLRAVRQPPAGGHGTRPET